MFSYIKKIYNQTILLDFEQSKKFVWKYVHVFIANFEQYKAKT